MYRYILFDLDGTLSDPKVGICTSFQYALSKMGIDEPDIDKLEPVIGPPLKDSFVGLYNMSDEEAEQAKKYYRERYSDVGKFENEIYPGIAELLRDLKKKGRVVAVASSKLTPYCEEILEHFGIREYFDYVVGSVLDGSRDKKEDIINEAIRRMFEGSEPDYDEVVMVGDRKYDIEAALNVGITSIGVTYGYGSREELEEAGAAKIVNTVEGLRSLLLIPMGFSASPQASRPAADRSDTEQKEKSPQDLKAMSKEIGRQSFANTWGFAGPALIYWLGSSAFFYALVFIVGLILKDKAEFPEYLTVVFFGVAHLIACLFVLKDFKSVSRHLKEQPAKTPDMKYVYMSFTADFLLAVGMGSFQKIAAAMQEVPEGTEVYVPPYIVCLLVFGIAIPVAAHFVFAGVCYHRAGRFMKGKIPILFTILITSFMERSTGISLALALLIGIAIYVYDKSGSYLMSLLSYTASVFLMTAVQYASTADSIIDQPRTPLILIAFAGIVMIAANWIDKKEHAPESAEE